MTEFTPAHEYAKIFPLNEGEPLWELSKRIKEHGLREPIVTLDGQVLDGRRREMACYKAGVEPTYRKFGSRKTDGTDPLEFVYDLNFHRRHLGEGDRKLAAARYATAKGGRPSEKPGQNGPVIPTNAEAAEKFGTSEREVKRAKQVVANGTPALQQAVSEGIVSVSDAAKVADQPAEVQDQAVETVRSGQARTLVAAIPTREPGDDEDEPDVVDAEGEVVPEKALKAFEQAKVLQGICRELDSLILRVEEIARGPGGRLIRFESFKQQLKDAKGNLWANRATHVCPYCHGENKKCESCKGEGWTAKHVWEQAPGNNAKARRA